MPQVVVAALVLLSAAGACGWWLEVANGVVYVGSYDDKVYALNAGNGNLLLSYTTGDEVYSSLAVANGVVYVGSRDHNVYALNATTGAKLWSYTTNELVYSSPAVANGVVYVGSLDDDVYAFSLGRGARAQPDEPASQSRAQGQRVSNALSTAHALGRFPRSSLRAGAPLAHPPGRGVVLTMDKVLQLGRASPGPMGEVVSINAQMWVAHAQPYSASLIAAAFESELAEVGVGALTLQSCRCRRAQADRCAGRAWLVYEVQAELT